MQAGFAVGPPDGVAPDLPAACGPSAPLVLPSCLSLHTEAGVLQAAGFWLTVQSQDAGSADIARSLLAATDHVRQVLPVMCVLDTYMRSSTIPAVDCALGRETLPRWLAKWLPLRAGDVGAGGASAGSASKGMGPAVGLGTPRDPAPPTDPWHPWEPMVTLHVAIRVDELLACWVALGLVPSSVQSLRPYGPDVGPPPSGTADSLRRSTMVRVCHLCPATFWGPTLDTFACHVAAHAAAARDARILAARAPSGLRSGWHTAHMHSTLARHAKRLGTAAAVSSESPGPWASAEVSALRAGISMDAPVPQRGADNQAGVQTGAQTGAQAGAQADVQDSAACTPCRPSDPRGARAACAVCGDRLVKQFQDAHAVWVWAGCCRRRCDGALCHVDCAPRFVALAHSFQS